MAAVAAVQLCCCAKAVPRYVNKWAWICSHKALWVKQAVGGFGLRALICQFLVLMNLRKWAKSMSIFVLHFNDHGRVSTHRRATGNQANRMTQPVDGSQPLLSPIPGQAQLAQKWNSHCVRVGVSEWAQKHQLPPTKTDLAPTAMQCAACQQQRPILGPQYSANSLRRPASLLVPSWLLRPSGRSIDFILN